MDMLKKWLRISPKPTQSNLITVLRERNVGFNQLAEELENKSFERDRVKMASTNVMMKTSLALKNKSVIKFGVLTLIVTVILIALRFSPNSKDRFTVIKTISGLENPCGVAVNQRGEIIVAESSGHYISMFSSTGEKLRSFGSQGSGPGPGQSSHPRGVAVDNDGNILVVDSNNNRIQKFTSDYKHITSVGGQGSNHLQFSHPILSVSISPITKKVVVSDFFNHRVQILNPDLTFHSSIG
ncbi:MAG: NHL repeat-containing protein, partial [Proteobacteria bacterium]|nr:NHL repeat-containing protein [Pseudomonadota bacterium]